MSVRWIMVCVGAFVFSSCQPAGAGDFDGTKALRCKTGDGLQYHRKGDQQPFNPESVGLPQTFIIDFKQNLIRPTRQSVVQRRSKIKRIERVEDKIVLQGAEDGVAGVDDGVGWTMAVMQDSGRYVITASGADVGYIVFGTCRAAMP